MFAPENARSFRRIFALLLLLAATALLSVAAGRYPVSVSEVFDVLAEKILGRDAGVSERSVSVIWNVRMPRVILACLIGCSLSAAGAAYQGVFQNPLASPDILGASSGAAFGAALALLAGTDGFGVAVSSFSFSLVAVGTVCLISRASGGKRALTMILAGIVVGALFTAGISFVKLVSDPTDQLPAITYWLMGSLSGGGREGLAFAFIPAFSGCLLLFALRWRINVLTLGDDEARSVGVNVSAVRSAVISGASLVTAASVAVGGIIGWVGLVVPHLARRVVGNDYRVLMPASMVFGALFLLLIDDAARCLSTREIPIGILTSFVGAPFFIWLIMRTETER